MNFRVIRKQVTSLSIIRTMRRSRAVGLGTVVCALLGTTVFAQTTSDFIDPLNEERIRVERSGDAPASSPSTREKPARPNITEREGEANGLLTRARDGATSGVATAQDRATGFWGKMRGAVSSVANSLGLSTPGLVGVLGLLIAGIAALVGWTLFKGRRQPRKHGKDVGVYARSRSTTKRRQLGDATPFEDTAEVEPEFEEAMPDDFDSIFEEERTTAPVPPKTNDASTWRKPNLDKLRNSIKADWKADKGRSNDENETFAPVTTSTLATRSDPAERSLNDISDGWEEWDEQVKPDDDPWGETLKTGDDIDQQDDAAIERIRALRESLRAS